MKTLPDGSVEIKRCAKEYLKNNMKTIEPIR